MLQCRAASTAAVLLLLLLGAASGAAAAPPPIQVDGWSSSSDVAKGLASKLVDGAKFTITGATYKGDKKAAGFATLRYYGRYKRGDTGKAPGHFLAPWFLDGAVCLSTAKIVGTSWPSMLALTASASAPEIPRSVRATRLTLSLKARATGYLRVPWTYQDAAYDYWNWDEGNEPYTNSTFRIAINGVQRGVIGTNRWMTVPNTLHIDSTWFGDDDEADVTKIGHLNTDLEEDVDDPVLPIEFEGVAYQYQTTRVLIKKGDPIKIDIVIADVPRPWEKDSDAPSILYFPPKAITLSSVDECKKNSDCGSGKRCCGGICCTKSVQCCSGKECCSNPASTCIAPNTLAPAVCCHGAASCVVGGKATCCPPGTRCVERNCVE